MAHETNGDGLIPAVSQLGRPESYWTERNALVSAVHAAGEHLPSGERKHVAAAERTTAEQALWDAYGEAVDRLKAYDAAHGGTPVL